jgi:DNA-binding transcriptional regulator YdaS (Cro superfamily)
MGDQWILAEREAAHLADHLEDDFGSELNELESALHAAGRGSPGEARRFLRIWSELAVRLIERSGVTELETYARQVLLESAPTAPFSPWVADLGLRRGLAVRLVVDLRALVSRAEALRPPRVEWSPWAKPAELQTALRLLRNALVHEVAPSLESSPLERVVDLFGLDRTELARLFGVSRQAVGQWLTRGVPAERSAKLTAVLSIGELLNRKLRPGVLPGVARRPAEAYGGKSMLELITADRHDWLLDDVRASFDWAASAA